MTHAAAAPLVPFDQAPAELDLLKPSWTEGVHELGAGDQVFGRLDHSTWKGSAKAESATGTWAFSREKGFLHRRLEVRDAGTDQPVAEFEPNTWTRGGQFELDGGTYELRVRGAFTTHYAWSRDSVELVEVEHRSSFGKDKGGVTITDAGRADPATPLLALLAVHVLLGDQQNAAAGAVATNAAVIST